VLLELHVVDCRRLPKNHRVGSRTFVNGTRRQRPKLLGVGRVVVVVKGAKEGDEVGGRVTGGRGGGPGTDGR